MSPMREAKRYEDEEESREDQEQRHRAGNGKMHEGNKWEGIEEALNARKKG